MPEREELLADLTTIGGGAALEKFDHELKKVLNNIRDLNTDPKAKRKIVLEIVFQPDEDRELVRTSVAARCVLASTKPTLANLFVGRAAGETVATVLQGGTPNEDPRQGVIPLEQRKA